MNKLQKEGKNNTYLTQEYIEQIINEARKKYNVPAVAVTIMNSDNIFIKSIQGTRISEINKPATLDDYFHIGSCSKSFLATIAGKMIEVGKINWNTKYIDVFPELKVQANPEYYDITLEDLFLCEAGIQTYTSGEEQFPLINPAIVNKRLEFINYLIREAPASKRKKNGKFEHLYSNASYTMASAMLERVSGRNYEELIKDHIIGQVGLNVYIGWPNNYNSEQPWGHILNGKNIEKFAPGHEYKIPYLLTPAGDLSLTPISFAKYIQLHLGGLKGQDNFIKSNTYQYIHFGHKGFSIGVVSGELAGHSFSGMDGSGGTFFCRAIIVPNSDFAFTIMMNAGSGTGQMKAVDWLTMRIVKKHYNWWWKFWL